MFVLKENRIVYVIMRDNNGFVMKGRCYLYWLVNVVIVIVEIVLVIYGGVDSSCVLVFENFMFIMIWGRVNLRVYVGIEEVMKMSVCRKIC